MKASFAIFGSLLWAIAIAAYLISFAGWWTMRALDPSNGPFVAITVALATLFTIPGSVLLGAAGIMHTLDKRLGPKKEPEYDVPYKRQIGGKTEPFP